MVERGRCRRLSPMVRKPAQPEQLHTELLETGDDPVQRGLVDQDTAKLGLRCHSCGLERMQRRDDVRAIRAAARMRPDPPDRTSPGTTSPEAAKFSPPMVTHVVDRRGLHALLTAKIDAAVTLVADAAGWDKTLLAASWLEAGVADCAAAWGEPAVALPRLGAVRTCSSRPASPAVMTPRGPATGGGTPPPLRTMPSHPARRKAGPGGVSLRGQPGVNRDPQWWPRPTSRARRWW